VLSFHEDEVIADIGCFDCYTTLQYFKYGNEKYKKIYSFEPEPTQYKLCKETIEKGGYDNWEIYNCGVYDETGKLYFDSNASCTKVSEEGNIEVDVIRLDDFFREHEAPTFIKMDIEGAELSALKGCSDTIRLYKPKLAICVYHKPEDIFEIPEYILSLNPDYKMYLRHYTNLVNETVLYCE
jgi:FkbM family methyltransferase